MKPKLWTSQSWSLINFDGLCYSTCLGKMSKVDDLRGKYNKRSAAPVMPSIVFLHFLLRFCGSYQLFSKMQFANVLVYVFGVFTLSFCYCFSEGFIHKIILVSRFLPLICFSYSFKVFKFDTRILRDSCAVPLLKTLIRLPQSIAFLCQILFLMFACNNFLFRAFLTMIYWVFNRSVAESCYSTGSYCAFSWLWADNVFWTSGFDSVSIAFYFLGVSISLPELYFSHLI